MAVYNGQILVWSRHEVNASSVVQQSLTSTVLKEPVANITLLLLADYTIDRLCRGDQLQIVI